MAKDFLLAINKLMLLSSIREQEVALPTEEKIDTTGMPTKQTLTTSMDVEARVRKTRRRQQF